MNHFRDLETRKALCETAGEPIEFVIGDITLGKKFCPDCKQIMILELEKEDD